MTSPVKRVMCLLALTGILVSCAKGNGGRQLLPPQFDRICKVNEQENGDSGVVNIRCDITSNDQQLWRLDTLRDWIMENNISQSERFSYDLICDQSGGSVSVPHPMKCPGLHGLTIRNCNVTDMFADFGNPILNTIDPTLTELVIIDSVMVQQRSNLYRMFANIDKLTSDYECLQDRVIERIVYRNVFYYIQDDTEEMMMKCVAEYLKSQGMTLEIGSGPDEQKSNSSGNSSELVDPVEPEPSSDSSKELVDICDSLNSGSIIDVPKRIKELDIRCDYERLRFLEDSSSSAMSIYDFKFLAKYNKFPVLEFYNSSDNNIDRVPEELEDWSYHFDVMKYIDLSHNRITTFSEFKSRFVEKQVNDTVINLQYNNITTLVPSDLAHLKNQQKQFIDIRNNPIVCDCELKDFVGALKEPDLFSGPLLKYRYIEDMMCYSPDDLYGRTLKSLNVDDLGCYSEDWIEPFIAVVLIAVFLLTVIVLAFIYRREIRILFYTRLNIQMPGVEYVGLGQKRYHAFVSYSNEDEDWVLDELCKQLEEPDSSTYSSESQKSKAQNQFKLCLHARDFVPGMTIIENIIKSIENSRHTLIVLTENFVQSKWAMEEFYQAYHQSVLERRRHLIIIIRGELPSEMNHVLKRCLKTFTYLKTSDKLFYDRLAYSLATENKMTKEESSRNEEILKSRDSSTTIDIGQDSDSGIFNTADDSFSSVAGLNTQTSVISTTNSEIALVDSTHL